MVPEPGFIWNGHQWNVRIPGAEGLGIDLDRKRLEPRAEIHWKGVNMALNLSQKQEVVAELAEVASKAQSLVAAEYAGVTVSQMTSMRKKARENGVFLKVVKNTLATRAVEGTEFDVVKDDLTGPLLYAFSMEDPGAAARLIKDYAKTNEKLKAKVVSIGGQKYPASHVDVLASLPTRDQALSMLLSVLVEPATRVARALKAIGEKDTAEA
jgi:large subunit ribosomal protein L10